MLASSRTLTGQYIILFYDRYGGKLKHKESTASYERAILTAETFIASNEEATSYTVDRRLFNSLDPLAPL
jgi:hypothetical protein